MEPGPGPNNAASHSDPGSRRVPCLSISSPVNSSRSGRERDMVSMASESWLRFFGALTRFAGKSRRREIKAQGNREAGNSRRRSAGSSLRKLHLDPVAPRRHEFRAAKPQPSSVRFPVRPGSRLLNRATILNLNLLARTYPSGSNRCPSVRSPSFGSSFFANCKKCGELR
jgi:hypothetical protein